MSAGIDVKTDGADRGSGDIYKAYEEHTKTLRTWLVAYGVGAPVLVLSNAKLSEVVLSGGHAWVIGAIFLAGVACQVLLAFINKNVMWLCYHGSEHPSFKESCIYKAAEKLSRQFWIDILLDLASIALMACATLRVFALIAR